MADKKDSLVNRQRYSSTFDIELLEKMKELSKETSIPMSKLLDKALELLLKEHNKI
ncbi:ribbon-helix-helix domain-containing protein [Clostridium septicum]|uniref:Ribbon-helix-helix domain-containing protein n=1 Tax=Clostridium septicum TaxID=1504 RepID=A0A9N7JPD0_CLOSE|nr:ribbon-helix-helix domain-containing protein [Clostridium septicum]AYE35332.1 ribbon-helix-helix domain-containing protein [Clostridium septicum]MDU1314843.1 ribbon-helix-helix domain-containing protein [Clostridium septicum]QAS60722.1 ribbon-helix-helix domain-containing protein [Clostridium septicum]UEC20013.1 ribbon-helix-helix domain-containing protein [Clostridium septicum]USS01930.1 ribbon-helix-helix domain-containing protein [Clostridium septicum]